MKNIVISFIITTLTLNLALWEKEIAIPAIPVIINFDQPLAATWRHHQLESLVSGNNDLLRKFPDTLKVQRLKPVKRRRKRLFLVAHKKMMKKVEWN